MVYGSGRENIAIIQNKLIYLRKWFRKTSGFNTNGDL